MTAPLRKILVTGGLGFQGFHLAQHWAREGREVTVLNTPSARAFRLADLLAQRLPPIRVVYGSVHDMEILEKTLPEQDAVVHLAAWASVDVSLDRPWPPFEINAQGTYALLDGLRRMNRTARVLVASSCEVYGPAQRVAPPGGDRTMCMACRVGMEHRHYGNGDLLPQREDTPMLPRSPYAATKIAADRFAYAFAVTYDLRLSILRPCNIFGPHQRAGGAGAVVPTFTRAALQGYPLTITGGGQQSREFLYVDDLVAAYAALLDREPETPGETYNVGSGETCTIDELARLVLAEVGGPSALLYGSQRVADVTGFLLDATAFRTRFGWKPTLTFSQGLTRYVAWARAHGGAGL
jgi:UDP-glucose 4-epimerase